MTDDQRKEWCLDLVQFIFRYYKDEETINAIKEQLKEEYNKQIENDNIKERRLEVLINKYNKFLQNKPEKNRALLEKIDIFKSKLDDKHNRLESFFKALDEYIENRFHTYIYRYRNVHIESNYQLDFFTNLCRTPFKYTYFKTLFADLLKITKASDFGINLQFIYSLFEKNYNIMNNCANDLSSTDKQYGKMINSSSKGISL